MKIIAIMALFLTLGASAQAVKPKTTPVVPVEVREKFFKAQSEYQNATAVAQQAEQNVKTKDTALREQMEKVKTVCGVEYDPNLDQEGEVVCVAKPATSPKK